MLLSKKHSFVYCVLIPLNQDQTPESSAKTSTTVSYLSVIQSQLTAWQYTETQTARPCKLFY